MLLPTKGFENVGSLYQNAGGGEIALCNLGAICVNQVSDEDYERVAYNTLKIVDNTIEKGVYPFPSVEHTAKARRSVGIGMTGLAQHLASKGLSYNTEEGRNEIHRIAERHSYWLHKASVRLAKEKGVCKWFDKTKYVVGWLPIDTYKRAVDDHHSQPLKFDWEALRSEIIEHGARFNVLESYMPTESSSLFSNTTNSLYPIRDKEIFKNSRKGMVYFRAPNFETLNYQNAYDIDHLDMVKVYAIIQKFTGQGISADFWSKLDGESTKLSMKDMLQRVLLAGKLGMKTMYYENFKTGSGESVEDGDDCESCKL